MNRTRRSLWLATLSAAALVIPAGGQTCTAISNPKIVRAEGYTEGVGDLLLNCTGGTPTPAGQVVPAINVILYFNTNITSTVTASQAGVAGNRDFNEALLLIDEPNRAVPVVATAPLISHPILNCGNTGAPDNGPSGPGVCAIVSDGNSADTYDGTQWVKGAKACTPSSLVPSGCCPISVNGGIDASAYGCGRPNVFQGSLNGTPNQFNQLVFLGVPFDPPGAGKVRTLRFTNLRADAALLTVGAPIRAQIVIQSGGQAPTVTPSNILLGSALPGLKAKVMPAKTMRVEEGYSSSWKPRNVGVALANSTYNGTNYTYNIGAENDRFSTNVYDLAQNVPGVAYNTEDGFEWFGVLSGTPEPQPSPNPPHGYASGIAGGGGLPLFNEYWLPPPTTINDPNIAIAGASKSGTRIALHFLPAGGETITVPTVANIYKTASPNGPPSGVMVLIQPSALDANGNGLFVAQTGSSYSITGGTLVYEVLYADPNSEEFADIKTSITGLGVSIVTPSFAPYYSPASTPNPGNAVAAGVVSPAVPRFSCGAAVANTPCIMGALMLML